MDEFNMDDFYEKLKELVAGMSADEILAVPGVYEVLAEDLNNAVIEALEFDKEVSADQALAEINAGTA